MFCSVKWALRMEKFNLQKNQTQDLMKKHWKLIFAVVYLLSPLDLVPDIIPVLGVTDDLIVIAIAVLLTYIDHKKQEFSDPRDFLMTFLQNLKVSQDPKNSKSSQNKFNKDTGDILEGEIIEKK